MSKLFSAIEVENVTVLYNNEKSKANRAICCSLLLGMLFQFGVNSGLADNPLILDQFSADPTARVFEGKIYVYPSHDIPVPPDSGARPNWFCMEDYHVYSSENLMDWADHGVILDQEDVPWLTRKSYNMWAPDCIQKDGKYYFYFPTGGKIGVAVAEKPYGPFTPEDTPIEGARGIDPCVFIDEDGTAYLYSSMNRIFVARLKEDMVGLDSEQQVIENLPQKGLIEGPFVFERKGIYYLTYPHVQNNTERLEYAVAKSPMGPFEWKGVIMDESASGCWTNHHSLVEYQGKWYLFYHDKDLSPDFDKNRSIRADYLFFAEDGSIQKVTPTLRGVGTADATKEIQVDRYSAVSPEGVSVDFLDTQQKEKGWKAIMSAKGAWVRYNHVDFGEQKVDSVRLRVTSQTGGGVEIRFDEVDGPLAAYVEIPIKDKWGIVSSKILNCPSGTHDLIAVLESGSNIEIDWVQFE